MIPFQDNSDTNLKRTTRYRDCLPFIDKGISAFLEKLQCPHNLQFEQLHVTNYNCYKTKLFNHHAEPIKIQEIYNALTRSKGKKKAEALDDLLPAFKATALPNQSTTGDPLEPPLVPDAAYNKYN